MSNLLRVLQAKRKRNNMGGLKIVVAGCVAAQEGEALLRRVPELDLVLGPHHANRLGPYTLFSKQCPPQASGAAPVCAKRGLRLGSLG